MCIDGLTTKAVFDDENEPEKMKTVWLVICGEDVVAVCATERAAKAFKAEFAFPTKIEEWEVER